MAPASHIQPWGGRTWPAVAGSGCAAKDLATVAAAANPPLPCHRHPRPAAAATLPRSTLTPSLLFPAPPLPCRKRPHPVVDAPHPPSTPPHMPLPNVATICPQPFLYPTPPLPRPITAAAQRGRSGNGGVKGSKEEG